jgi:hypothetical protein
MHVPTHILSGWCVANLLPLTARERLFCMVAAAAADIDGLGIVVSEELYWDYHHKLGHGIAFGLLLAGAMAAFSTRRLVAMVAYLACFHLHLVLDSFGSGPDWPIHYLWPISDAAWLNPRAWNLSSWQNTTAAALLLAWTAWIGFRHRRTPLELLMPSLDEKAIAWIDRRRGVATDPRWRGFEVDNSPRSQ